ECIADLAKKLWRAFAGRFARTVTERQLSLHFISGRNAHSHRRDGEFQTRAGTAGGGNERSDRALLFEWNVCSVTRIGHRATLEKDLCHDRKTVVIFGNDQRPHRLGIDCGGNGKCGARAGVATLKVAQRNPAISSDGYTE